MKFTMLMLEIRSGLPGFTGHYSEGVGSIAAVIKQAGHDFELLHLTRPEDARELAVEVAETDPDVIGLSCMTHTFPYVRSFAKAIKERLPRTPTVLGGVHAILNPEESIGVDGVDAVCLGEGETVVLPLLERLADGQSFADVEGLWVKHDGQVLRNPPTPLIQELDSLPAPDRSVFDFSRLVSTREGVLYVFASRGCPYDCAFCSNAAIRARSPNPTKYLRYKSVAHVCREIESAAREFPGTLRGIYFQDEILTLNRSWLAEFAEVYPRRIGVPFNCNLRADLVTPRVAEQLQRAGCNSVSIGLESGVERIRGGVLGKNISDAEFHTAFERLRDHGMQINTFSMVGLPEETPTEALTTVFFNAESGVDKNMVSIFCPYPGTPLFEKVVAKGILSDRMPDTYQDDTPLDQTSISAGQVRFIHDFFNAIIFLLRLRWPGRRLKRPLIRFVERDGISLRLLSAVKRTLMHALAGPYLLAGRCLFDRQARVFKKQVSVCSPLAGRRDG